MDEVIYKINCYSSKEKTEHPVFTTECKRCVGAMKTALDLSKVYGYTEVIREKREEIRFISSFTKGKINKQ